MALAAAHARALGGRVKLHRAARSLATCWRRASGPSQKPVPPSRILLLGHLDTVWPLGTLKTMPCRIGEGRLWGPGALDMKAGAAMAFTAIEMLIEAGLLQQRNRPAAEQRRGGWQPGFAAHHRAAGGRVRCRFVLEPAQGLAFKTARKGTGDWRIDVKGVAAHAGVDFEKGVSAIRELARVVETVSGWTDLKRGLTVSVGLAGGGSRTNVIPAQAWAEVDVRIARKSDAPRVERKFAALRPADKRCSLSVTGGFNRPPMERTRATVRLFRQARALAAELGFRSKRLPRAAPPTATSPPPSAFLPWTAWAPWARARTRATNRSCWSIWRPRTALLAGMMALRSADWPG